MKQISNNYSYSVIDDINTDILHLDIWWAIYFFHNDVAFAKMHFSRSTLLVFFFDKTLKNKKIEI